jgi:hypothetical protein
VPNHRAKDFRHPVAEKCEKDISTLGPDQPTFHASHINAKKIKLI